MLNAFVNKASRERLCKYLIEAKWGVEDGDTQLKNASTASVRMQKMVAFLPGVLLLLGVVAVGLAQLWGRFGKGAVGTADDSSCSWVTPS